MFVVTLPFSTTRLKHYFHIFLMCFTAVILSVTLNGCQEKQKIRIGVAQCSYDDWRVKLNSELEREMLVYPDAELEIMSA